MDGGVRIVFDPTIDRGCWSGPRVVASASVGEPWLGPAGLLGLLETELGLTGRHLSTPERALDLATTLDSSSGFWRASFEADRIGTSMRLLRDRDTLALWGWHGEPASPRLAELWAATAGAAPGLPDRLGAVRRTLTERAGDVDVASIDLLSPAVGLPTAWRALLHDLADHGVRVRERSLPTAPLPAGDLGRARSATFVPEGDGTLTLLRAYGPLAAAGEVAASMAALPSLDGVVVVGADATLDAALARHGLPRLGAHVAAPASTALVRLVVEAAFEPMEPADLHALLCLDPGPVPRRVAARLVTALNKLPGRRSPLWAQALEDGLALGDAGGRSATEARLAALLVPSSRRDGAVDAGDICRRLDTVFVWASGRARALPGLHAVARRAATARAVIARAGSAPLTLLALRRLCDELDDDLAGSAEAGLAGVAHPGAVLAPAETIVWWGFTRASAALPARVRLSVEERAALGRLGVTPPDPGRAILAEALRWRRPLEMAARTLVLVCPATNAAGEGEFPHPLWDELVAALSDRRRAALLERSELVLAARAPPVRRRVAPRPLPVPASTARSGRPIELRAQESPSSLERLLGCSLSWTLRYHGRLEPGLSWGPPAPSPILYGTLAHHFLAAVFAGGVLDPDAAAESAARRVEDGLSGLCESLGLPRYQVERTTLKQVIVDSARELGRLLVASGATVRGVELEASRLLDGIAVHGIADLVLTGPDAIIDLKWGKTTNRDKLVAGTALQLAAYAELFAGATRPEVGYFVLRTQELLGEPGSALPRVQSPGRATSADIWRGARASLDERRRELARGDLLAPGASVKDALGERLVIAPPCDTCDHASLCGQRATP